MKKNKPAISYDPLIIPRVKQYLEENVHQTYVDVSVMAKELQDRYREYSRRKTVPFRVLVEQAYKTVLHSYGLDSNPSSDNDGEGNSDLEMMDDDATGSNHMSDTLTSMYMTSKGKNTNQNDGDELIDISSDESGDENVQTVSHSDKGNNYKIPGVTITKLKPGNQQHGQSSSCNQTNQQSHVSSQNQKVPPRSHSNQQQQPPPPHSDGSMQQMRKFFNAPSQSSSSYPIPNVNHNYNVHSNNNNSNNSNNNNNTNTTSSFQQNVQNQNLKKRKLENDVVLLNKDQMGKQSNKKIKNSVPVCYNKTTFKDVGGMEHILKDLCELLLHVKHPYIYKHIGLLPPRGFLLHGPPGSGKTLLAEAIAGQLEVPLVRVNATELVAGVSGESEGRIRDLFAQATSIAPCVIFIDEVDAITSNRINASKDMERRIVSQLLSSFDGLSKEQGGDQVLVIGATNRPDVIDPALRRVGRFDQEISLGIPDREARKDILKIICRTLRIEGFFDYEKLALLTPGYVGADLLALATRAASTAIKRIFTSKEEELIETEIKSMKTSSELTKSLPNIVNLTEDTVIMDVDDDNNKVSDNINDSNKKEIVSDTGTKDNEKTDETELKNTTTTTTTTSTTESLINEQKETSDSMEIENAEVSTTTPVQSTETESNTNNQNEVTTSVDDVVINEEDVNKKQTNEDKEKQSQPTSFSDSITIDDDKVEEINLSDENENSQQEIPEKLQKSDDKNDKDDIEINLIDDSVNDRVECLDDSFTEISNKLPRLKLTLNDMLNWLTEKSPIVHEEELKNLSITMDDFVEALKYVQPSAKREGFITVPDTTWDDVGSLNHIRAELNLAILIPVKYPQKLKVLGLTSPSGILLWGPPGCGKTLIAKAIANEAGINFISVKGPELLNMYVGESERAVRQCFVRARNSAPCVIFFDEFDSLCPKRSAVGENGAGSRLVNQLLTEMDGFEERKGVYLMAATNRPDMIDPAVLRPGRLDKMLYIGLPNKDDRIDVLEAITKKRTKPIISSDVDFEELAKTTEFFSGADLAGLVREASLLSLQDSISPDNKTSLVPDDDMKVHNVHFRRALKKIIPSVSSEEIQHYERLRRKYESTDEKKSE